MKRAGIRNRWRRTVVLGAVAATLGAGALGMARPAVAQEATPTAGAAGGAATVSVTGQGSVTVTPDTASIQVGVNIIQPTLSEAQAEATTEMTAVIDALTAAGIEQKDIQTTNYSVNILQDFDPNGNPTTINGFQVSNQVNVTVRDLATLGEILDTVVGAGANSIYGIYFFVDDPSAAQTQARTAAVDDARTRAQELADAAGLTLGRILSISEGFSAAPMPMGFGQADAAEGRAAVPIQAGSTTITVDVQVVFELEQ